MNTKKKKVTPKANLATYPNILELEAIDSLTRKLRKDFGKKFCGDFNWDCPSCRAHAMISLLDWYRDLLDLLETE